jgi:hypothetical protein
MSTQHQQWILLDECITDYMQEAEIGQHKYMKLWSLAFRCLTQLGLDFFYTVQSVKLPVNANLTVNLPPNYLNYTKIGVLNDVGEVIPLWFNSNLTTYADLSPNRLADTEDANLLANLNPSSGNFYNYWTGYGYATIYGVPSGAPFLGSFKIDNENGLILLEDGFSYSYLMVEYVASPPEDSEYRIPIQFKEAVIAYLAWKNAKIGSSRYAWRIEGNLKHEYHLERKAAIARWKPFIIEEAYQSSQAQSRLAIKS